MSNTTVEIRDINSLADLKHQLLQFRKEANYNIGTARLFGKNIIQDIEQIERQLLQELQECENDLISAEAELYSCECYVPDEDEDHDCYAEQNKVINARKIVVEAKRKHNEAMRLLSEANSVHQDFDRNNRFFIELITDHTGKAVHVLTKLMNDIFDYLGISRRENTNVDSINIIDPNLPEEEIPADKRIVQVMYDENGNPIRNKRVSIQLNNLSVVEGVYTDENGKAILEGNINGAFGDVCVDGRKIYSGVLSNNMEYNKRGDGSVNHNFELTGKRNFYSPYTKNDGTSGNKVESEVINSNTVWSGDLRREESFKQGTFSLKHEINNVRDGKKAESYNGWIKHKKARVMERLSDNIKLTYQKLQRQEQITKDNWRDFVGRDFYSHNIDRYKNDSRKMEDLLNWYQDKMERFLKDAEDLSGSKRQGFPRDENEREKWRDDLFDRQK